MKRKFIFVLHLAYWLVYLLLLLIMISAVNLQSNQKPSVFNVLFFTPIGFLCVFPKLILITKNREESKSSRFGSVKKTLDK